MKRIFTITIITILLVFFGLLSLSMILLLLTDTSFSNLMVYFGLLLIFVCIILALAKKLKNVITTNPETIHQQSLEKQNSRKEEQYRKEHSAVLKHINGLPIAENVFCTIFEGQNSLIFTCGNLNFELNKSQITDICLKTDKEIQQQYVSSVGGAIGGSVLFGPLGAIIGGRAKKKTLSNITTYLIITYHSNNTIKYIGFDASGNFRFSRKLVDEYKKHCSQQTVYHL